MSHKALVSNYPNIVVGKYSIGGLPDYMITSNADIKFGIKNIKFDSMTKMDGCLCFKDGFQKYALSTLGKTLCSENQLIDRLKSFK